MGLIRCPNGHMFSERRYGSICPYCNIDTSKKERVEPVQEKIDIETNLLYQEVDPVCGWLVCIQGTRVGKDYKIKSGKNFIGRADDMDVQIIGDNDIATRNHAIIVYDPKKKNNVLLPGDSSGIAYLNGEPAYMPSELSAYDVIELGKSKFLFVPFCGEHFEWQDNEKE
ncbi:MULTISPECIES: FHA domain-containing protein [unclassified Clostridium]|uniref:FHA domain-containing protein n=1 Tax=unclassified Clostridium TaxID=2614128 RepID=UPI000298594B|nr:MULTISPECIES: FHA domain-containing protein [unclassified Clostridium]EKQ51000.1 MAG: FHA domain-containing protein [Clostridium sp. Maddingley MBC34-26]